MRFVASIAIACVLLIASACLFFRSLDHAASAKENDRSATTYLSRITLEIDRSAAAEKGIRVQEISKAIDSFFSAHTNFRLSELQAVEIPTESSMKVPLREVAKVEVDFIPAK